MDDFEKLPATKPYLLRAIWEWCCDHGYTPHISVEVDEYTQVPQEYVRSGQIVLNIGATAANKLQMGNDFIDFHARFNGVARALSVPVTRVSGIYARENGVGLSFEVEETTADSLNSATAQSSRKPVEASRSSDDDKPPPPSSSGGRSHLRVVK